MIDSIPHFCYSSTDARQLHAAVAWIDTALSNISFPELAAAMDLVFDGNWLAWRILREKLSPADIVLTVIDGVRLKELMAWLLITNKSTFDSVEGQFLNPLLVDLHALNNRKVPTACGIHRAGSL
jgi:hypothetical protein